MTKADLFIAVTATVSFCALLTAVVPEPKNPTARKIWNIINFVGSNFGHAKNKGGK